MELEQKVSELESLVERLERRLREVEDRLSPIQSLSGAVYKSLPRQWRCEIRRLVRPFDAVELSPTYKQDIIDCLNYWIQKYETSEDSPKLDEEEMYTRIQELVPLLEATEFIYLTG